ncbi:MAG: hypothetical protein E7648_01630 [Ruminococcaceae bacterium]|nr:hypothetical protein [Oscillospiraceae bacterium]
MSEVVRANANNERSRANTSSMRNSNGYSRIKNGEHKRRGVTRSPNMSNPNARAAKADVAVGSIPVSVPAKKMAVPVASVRTEPTVRTVTDTTKTAFPYSVVFLSLLCSLLFFYMIFNYVQINEHTSTVSDLKSEIATLSFEAEDLTAKLDIKNDLTVIEKIAKEKLGMVTVDEVAKKYITMDPGDTIDPSK